MTSENSQPSTATHAGVIGTARVKRGMAEMLKGGVIMDVVTADQAKIAEDAGAVAVMALERVPADIRAQGGVARMSDPDLIDGIIEAVSQTALARRGPLVRLLRLAGHAPEPHSLELDDTWPENLGRPGARSTAGTEGKGA